MDWLPDQLVTRRILNGGLQLRDLPKGSEIQKNVSTKYSPHIEASKMSLNKQLQHALELQRTAWNNGHENYGASIDVEAEALEILQYFKHLNPVQTDLRAVLEAKDELKYAKPLASAARKAVRHFVVTLK